MKAQFLFAIATLALAGCGSADKPADKAPEAPNAEAPTASAAPATTPAKGDKPTKEYLVGKWGTNGDCAMAMDLRTDGTSDGPFGNWNYSDGVITFADAPGLKISVTVVDDKTMDSVNEGPDGQGKSNKMTRCP